MKRRSKSIDMGNAIAGLIFFALSSAVAVGILMGLWALRDSELERKADWLQAEGKIVRVEKHDAILSNPPVPAHEHADVTFSRNGAPVRTTVPNDEERPVGGTIDLIYNPADPTEVRKASYCFLTCVSLASVIVVMVPVMIAGYFLVGGMAVLYDELSK